VVFEASHLRYQNYVLFDIPVTGLDLSKGTAYYRIACGDEPMHNICQATDVQPTIQRRGDRNQAPPWLDIA